MKIITIELCNIWILLMPRTHGSCHASFIAILFNCSLSFKQYYETYSQVHPLCTFYPTILPFYIKPSIAFIYFINLKHFLYLSNNFTFMMYISLMYILAKCDIFIDYTDCNKKNYTIRKLYFWKLSQDKFKIIVSY